MRYILQYIHWFLSTSFIEKYKALTPSLTRRDEMPPHILNKTNASTSGRYQLDVGGSFGGLKSMLTFLHSIEKLSGNQGYKQVDNSIENNV